MRRALIALFTLLLGAGAVLTAAWGLAAPSHDRAWPPVYERVATVAHTPHGVRLGNVRNWSYAPDGTPAARDWITARLDEDDLVRVWFLMEPFSDNPAIAHTMLAFEFAGGAAYVASVEARRETGESYSALRGALWPAYEYLWVWSTERDAYANSTWYTEDQLYLYPLDLPPEDARAVLRRVLADTARVEDKPRWYNTLLANCTNVLARAVNAGGGPRGLPWDISWVLPGYADSFLAREGYIAAPEGFAAAERAAHITPLIPAAYEQSDPAAFSRRLRALMGG
ncbi:protein of unknown function [Rhodovulum sp. ES.010]|uniref:lipoprotein N-acyltransferase Lnb domain-containing protein n=1 Tax=Rhodovulum sp. ES.010 TaxID=1882821 RepID=UPI000929B2C9|nr:DUF4105 domain-containing protein [Rhodovulum sp. ES.010]SIO23484.1 protein of unknown function [Rhodovulum sp. ES.010]